jgi:proteasome accessory factor C
MNPSIRQATRMLALVPYLQSHAGIPVRELAREFNVTPSRIRQDVKLLAFTGTGELHGELIDIDFEALDGEDLVFIRDAEFMPRPLRFTRQESVALITALRMLRSTTGDQVGIIDSTLAKLEGSVDTAAANAATLITREVDPLILSTVEAGIRAQHVIALTYGTESRDERTEREVDPIGLHLVAGERYLTAWCHRAEDFRQFRLDRIFKATDTGREVEGDHGEAPSPQTFTAAANAPSALLEISPQAQWLTDFYPVDIEDRRDDGTIIGRIHSSDDSWLRRLVLRLSGQVRVLEPESLAQSVQECARSALSAYDRDI